MLVEPELVSALINDGLALIWLGGIFAIDNVKEFNKDTIGTRCEEVDENSIISSGTLREDGVAKCEEVCWSHESICKELPTDANEFVSADDVSSGIVDSVIMPVLDEDVSLVCEEPGCSSNSGCTICEELPTDANEFGMYASLAVDVRVECEESG